MNILHRLKTLPTLHLLHRWEMMVAHVAVSVSRTALGSSGWDEGVEPGSATLGGLVSASGADIALFDQYEDAA